MPDLPDIEDQIIELLMPVKDETDIKVMRICRDGIEVFVMIERGKR